MFGEFNEDKAAIACTSLNASFFSDSPYNFFSVRLTAYIFPSNRWTTFKTLPKPPFAINPKSANSDRKRSIRAVSFISSLLLLLFDILLLCAGNSFACSSSLKNAFAISVAIGATFPSLHLHQLHHDVVVVCLELVALRTCYC